MLVTAISEEDHPATLNSYPLCGSGRRDRCIGRRNLNKYQFKLLVGREYELEKKLHGGDRKSEEFQESKGQSGPLIPEPKTTAEKIAEEHGISEKTVKRSADLYKSHGAIKQVAPKVAEKLETEEIKASEKDIRTLGKVLQKGTPEQILFIGRLGRI